MEFDSLNLLLDYCLNSNLFVVKVGCPHRQDGYTLREWKSHASNAHNAPSLHTWLTDFVCKCCLQY